MPRGVDHDAAEAPEDLMHLEAGLLALLAGSTTSAEGDQPAGPVAGEIDPDEPVSDEPLNGLAVDLVLREQAN